MSGIAEFDQVVREIEDEVAARRASGDIPPGLERELDVIFDRFAPVQGSGDDLEAVLAATERSSAIDLDVPTGSNIWGLSPFKRGLRKLMEWYLRYLAQQVSELAVSWAGAFRVLSGRVKSLEAAVTVGDPAAEEDQRRSGAPALTTFEKRIAEAFAGVSGRVLVTECADATVVQRLVGSGLDAYGVDPDPALVEAAVAAGSEVRAGEALDHLQGVAEGGLGAVVLHGCVDRLALATTLELVDRAASALADGGRLALVATSPATWRRSVDVITADLAPGCPLHADTWFALLARRGFTELASHDGPPLATLQAVPPGEYADVLNANLAHIEEALFGPASFVVTGVRCR